MIRITVESPWYRETYTDPDTGAVTETMRSPMIADVAMEHSGHWTDITRQPCALIPQPPASSVVYAGLVTDDVAIEIIADARFEWYGSVVVPGEEPVKVAMMRFAGKIGDAGQPNAGKAPERKPDTLITGQERAALASAWGKSVAASVKTWRDVVRVRVADLGGQAA